jgi:hypothetical protein
VKGLLLCRNSVVSSCKSAKPPVLFCCPRLRNRIGRSVQRWPGQCGSMYFVGADDGHGRISISVFLLSNYIYLGYLSCWKWMSPARLGRRSDANAGGSFRFSVSVEIMGCGFWQTDNRQDNCHHGKVRMRTSRSRRKGKITRMMWFVARMEGGKSFTFGPTVHFNLKSHPAVGTGCGWPAFIDASRKPAATRELSMRNPQPCNFGGF